MSPDIGTPRPGNQDLQFDKAEFNDSSTPILSCVACKKTVGEYYFEVNGKTLCEGCKRKVEARYTGGSKVKRFLKASLAGGLAALLGFGVYFGIEKTTGHEFGLVAILVGVMVGAAVRWGSNSFGGWPYQLLAMFLTYNAIALTYLPQAMSELGDQFKDKSLVSENQVQPTPAAANISVTPNAVPSAANAALPASNNPAPADQSNSLAAPLTKSDKNNNQVSALTLLLGLSGILLLAYSLPFLMGFQNIVGWVILGIGLYQAWKINKKRLIHINGPYRAGSPKAPPPAP